MKANNFDFVVEKHKAVLLKMFEWNEHPSYYNNLSHWEIFAMFVNDFLKKHCFNRNPFTSLRKNCFEKSKEFSEEKCLKQLFEMIGENQ